MPEAAVATYTVEEARKILGASRNVAYQEIAEHGTLAGVRVIRYGKKRIRIPRVAFDRVMAGEVAA